MINKLEYDHFQSGKFQVPWNICLLPLNDIVVDELDNDCMY